MDLNLTPDEKRFRDEFRAWLAANVPEEWAGGGTGSEERAEYVKYLREWQRKLYDGGWAGISWPKEFGGRGATLMEQAIFQEELARAGAPPLVGTIGLSLVGPTIIALGTAEQKARYLPKILSGEEIWCQGFSEPNAGSDVAAVGTKAARDGDEFIINGQKIWTSFAQMADWCLLLVRTDGEAPKHKGLTCLLADMHAEGVAVRPLRQMSGDSGFNEVFFSNVRVPVVQVLGEVNKGWTTAIAALMNERANLGTGIQVIFKRNLEALVARARTVERAGLPRTRNPAPQHQPRADLALEDRHPRPRRLDAETLLERDEPAHAAGRAGDTRPLRPAQRLRQRHVGVRLPARARQHHRGGHQRNPTQHHRRARARAAKKLLKEVMRTED